MAKLKTYKTARGILKAAIADIEAGQWCGVELAQLNYHDEAHNVVLEDMLAHPSKFRKAYTEARKKAKEAGVKLGRRFGGGDTLADKPIGCALGLCVMHGGEGLEILVTNGQIFNLIHVDYPTKNSAPHILRAVRALYDAIPAGRRYYSENPTLKNQINAITSYNDDRSQMGALKWFKAALAIVKN